MRHSCPVYLEVFPLFRHMFLVTLLQRLSAFLLIRYGQDNLPAKSRVRGINSTLWCCSFNPGETRKWHWKMSHIRTAWGGGQNFLECWRSLLVWLRTCEHRHSSGVEPADRAWPPFLPINSLCECPDRRANGTHSYLIQLLLFPDTSLTLQYSCWDSCPTSVFPHLLCLIISYCLPQ